MSLHIVSYGRGQLCLWHCFFCQHEDLHLLTGFLCGCACSWNSFLTSLMWSYHPILAFNRTWKPGCSRHLTVMWQLFCATLLKTTFVQCSCSIFCCSITLITYSNNNYYYYYNLHSELSQCCSVYPSVVCSQDICLERHLYVLCVKGGSLSLETRWRSVPESTGVRCVPRQCHRRCQFLHWLSVLLNHHGPMTRPTLRASAWRPALIKVCTILILKCLLKVFMLLLTMLDDNVLIKYSIKCLPDICIACECERHIIEWSFVIWHRYERIICI